MSKGEEKIAYILKKAHIKFIREKTFRDLRQGLYKFDFFIPHMNMVIELDGEQHFKHVKYFHKTRKDFLAAKERDRRKNSYCLSHGIYLYRIPFWELDNINSFKDITQNKFRVLSKFHNDNLSIPKH